MSALSSIIADCKEDTQTAVRYAKEDLQYRMLLAGDTILEGVKSLRSLQESMTHLGIPFYVESLKIQLDFIEKRATRLKAGE